MKQTFLYVFSFFFEGGNFPLGLSPLISLLVSVLFLEVCFTVFTFIDSLH